MSRIRVERYILSCVGDRADDEGTVRFTGSAGPEFVRGVLTHVVAAPSAMSADLEALLRGEAEAAVSLFFDAHRAEYAEAGVPEDQQRGLASDAALLPIVAALFEVVRCEIGERPVWPDPAGTIARRMAGVAGPLTALGLQRALAFGDFPCFAERLARTPDLVLAKGERFRIALRPTDARLRSPAYVVAMFVAECMGNDDADETAGADGASA